MLAEKYEVVRILGEGGMGVVVAARHRELDKLVALKFMHDTFAANETAIDRFLREARAAARLRNEHVAAVLDVGRLPSGVPYIVMEFLEGYDLGQVVSVRGPMAVVDVVEYVLQTCEAMAEAHLTGIVHRDLKPQNLFLTFRPDGRPLVKVLDFGISKAAFQQGATATQQAMGTPAYMAPEQMRSARSVDARADIWSLGVILYQLLAGALPWSGENIAEIMLKVIQEPLPPIQMVRPDLPPQLVAAIERCLQKDREHRFGTVAELAQALTPLAPETARGAMLMIQRAMVAAPAPTDPRTVASYPATPAPSFAAPPRTQNVHGATVASLPETPAPRHAGTPGFMTPVMPSAVASAVTPSGQQTTLGAAASQVPTATPASPMRWVALMVVAVAAAVVITVFAVRGDRVAATVPEVAIDAAPAPAVVANVVDAAPVALDIAIVDAAPQAIDAAIAIDARVDRPRDAGVRRTVDAGVVAPPIDAGLRPAVTIDAAVVSIDAAIPPVDAPKLEPARTLEPAREGTKK